jgi:hypothetical protein
MTGLLEQYARLIGLPIRDGEAHRPAELCRIYAKRGTGIRNSKHKYSLARDYWIVIGDNGRRIDWARTRESKLKYEALGKFWEFIGGTWGGRFKRYDPFHFEYPGRPA